MARVLAIDFGLKRTGIAVSDELQIIASGLTTVNSIELIEFLKDYLKKENVETIIVGEPKQKDGTASSIEDEIQSFLNKLNDEFPETPIERIDERYTSKMAVKSMIEGGIKRKKRQNKAIIDEISATIILQDYLYNKK